MHTYSKNVTHSSEILNIHKHISLSLCKQLKIIFYLNHLDHSFVLNKNYYLAIFVR